MTITNIDPSFCSSIQTQKFIEESFLDETEVNTPVWIREGDDPNIEPYLRVQQIGEQEGPWIALDGYVSQENKDLKREIFFFIRSFLVPKEDKDEILDFLKDQDLGGGWLPDKLEFSQTFFSELPWSSVFPDEDSCDLSFVIGEEIVLRQKPKVEIRRTDKGVSFITHDEMEEYEEIQKEYKTFKAIMPVCELRQDVPDGESGRIPVLTKEMITKMELLGQPQSFDLHKKCGEKITHFVFYKGKGYKDRHSMYYLREDLLKKFIEDNGLCLIWAAWGERSYSFAWPERPDSSLPEPRYKIFGWIKQHQF